MNSWLTHILFQIVNNKNIKYYMADMIIGYAIILWNHSKVDNRKC